MWELLRRQTQPRIRHRGWVYSGEQTRVSSRERPSQSAVLHEKIERLGEELDRLERFMREVARTVLGTEIVLAHWAAVAGGSRSGADEDRILAEMRRAGEQELRGFLEEECPGLLERLEAARKKPPVH